MTSEASQNHDLAIFALVRQVNSLSLATSDGVMDLAEKLYLINEELRHLRPYDPLPAWQMNFTLLNKLDRSYRIVIFDILRENGMISMPYWDFVKRVQREEEILEFSAQLDADAARALEQKRAQARKAAAQTCVGCRRRGHLHKDCVKNSANWPLPRWKQEKFRFNAQGVRKRRKGSALP